MKVNSNNRDISFQGFYDSKVLKKGLELASDNGALFAATTTLTLSLGVRPTVILATPNTDKENKKMAFTKSVASSFTGFLLMLVLSKPLSKSIKNIDKNPELYLKKETCENLKETGKKLTDSKAYSLATQMFKLGLGLLASIPKAILTTATIPYVMNTVFPKNDATKKGNNPSFKGKNSLSNGIGKILDNKKVQEFSKKYKDTNFPMHIIACTDILSTGAFIHEINKSKKIEDATKPALCYNALISTVACIISGYGIDKLTNKPTQKFIEKFKQANRHDPKLNKYMEGIKIAKPIAILGLVYYLIIPFISTYLADRVEAKSSNNLIKKI